MGAAASGEVRNPAAKPGAAPAPTDYDVVLKIVLVGETAGKSRLMARFVGKEYKEHSTIGVDLGAKVVDVDGKRVKLQIWDTASQERFRTLSSAYYRGARGIMLVFDLSSRDTFLRLPPWLDQIRGPDQRPLLLLVGNMSDIGPPARKVSREEAQAFADEHGLPYIETSALDGTNVEHAFMALARSIMNGTPIVVPPPAPAAAALNLPVAAAAAALNVAVAPDSAAINVPAPAPPAALNVPVPASADAATADATAVAAAAGSESSVAQLHVPAPPVALESASAGPALNVPALVDPPPAVGGAGTASTTAVPVAADAAAVALNVPIPADDVSATALSWALQAATFAADVDAAAGVDATAAPLAERLARVQTAGLERSPEAVEERMRALRSGAIAGDTRLEREYAALFAPARTARASIAAVLAGGDASVGPPCPTVDDLKTGRRLPSAAVASLLQVSPAAVVSANGAVEAAVAAASPHAAFLSDVYDGLDVEPATAAARLRVLALRGAEGTTPPATAAERAYAACFERVREFRQAAAAALGSGSGGGAASAPA